jgi:hypothetical protein
MLSILFAGTGIFRLESLSKNAAAENFKIVSEKTAFEVWTNNFFVISTVLTVFLVIPF